jgi:peptidoglycan/LPS O-acetylase OafA/YrhL
VDGFFLLSAYLIVKSWQQRPDLILFLRNRMLRILPGYFVAALLSTLVVGWLAPGIDHFFRHLDLHFVKSLVAIGAPSTPPVFPGKPEALAQVNGALWTIQYEFRCYLMVALFGLCGLLHRRIFWLIATVVALAAMVSPLRDISHWSLSLFPLIGDPTQIFRLTAVYFVGGCFFLYKDQIKFRPIFAVLALAAILCVRIFNPARIEVAIDLFGDYLMFYFGQLTLKSLAWMKNVPDISYGIYVYGWPVLSLWIWFRHGSPWVAFGVATIISFILGWLSWHFVESPALSLKHRALFSRTVSVVQQVA